MTARAQTWVIGEAQLALEAISNDRWLLGLAGSLSAPDALQQLTAIIDVVDARATDARCALVTVDLTGLVYSSAALWRALAYWLGALKKPPVARYRLAVRIDESRSWQQIGRSMLAAFGSKSLVDDPV